MAHNYDWPSGTGVGVGTCRQCGVTLRFARTGPQGGKKREWHTPDGGVYRQGRDALDGEPPCVGGVVGPKPIGRAYEELSTDHKRGLAASMWEARDIAHRTPSVRRIMIRQIKHLACYWTTSAYCPTRGAVIPDAIKRDLRYMPHTADAHLAIKAGATGGDEIVHEHCVPRSLLAQYVASEAASLDDVTAVFDRHCKAVLITKDEDSRLNSGGLRDKMPTGWTWGADPLARYHALGIRVFEPMTDEHCACGVQVAGDNFGPCGPP